MSLLPADPVKRRAEEQARERARTDAFERGYAQGRAFATAIMEMRGGAALAASPTPSLPSHIRSLALDIGQDRILLPKAVTISRAFTEGGDEIATHISFPPCQ